MKSPGYDALHHSAGVIDLSSRGRLRVTGDDRARLLHAMTTNHVQQLQPGLGLYAFFLDAQGRIQSDANIFCFEDHLLLDVEPERREFLRDHLDRYIIADDVTVEDVTGETWCLAVEGPQAQPPVDLTTPFSHSGRNGSTFALVSYTGEQGYRIFGNGERPLFDFPDCDIDSAEIVRIEHFKPRYGVDITDKTIPQESQQMHAVHFQKGCYIGQEIVERVRARGHVNRLLMGFKIDSPVLVAAGSKVVSEGKDVGDVTSSAVGYSDKTFGLAMVRVPTAAPGATVQINKQQATIYKPY